MSDALLRDLERQAERGDPAAHDRLLVERERRGVVSRAQLELAAYVGFAPALRVLGRAPAPRDDLLVWGRGFHAFGQEACVRVVAAAAAALWTSLYQPQGDTSRGGLDALAPWLECPCAAHAESPRALASERWGDFTHFAGLLLACEWEAGERPGPAVVLLRGLSREGAETVRRDLERIRAGAADVAPDGEAWALRLRECFPLSAASRGDLVVALRRVDVRAAATFAAIDGVNAVLAVLHHARRKRDRRAVCAAVCEALVAPALRP